MSLLLDALRRAGAARGDGIVEPVNRDSGADANAGGADGADELDLDVDAATAPQAGGDAGGDQAGTSLNGPARAEAVFRGGASGASIIKTTGLFVLGTFAVVGGLLVGGWYYYESTRSAVDRELVRYTPDMETANGATGGDSDPSAAQSLDPDALATEPSDAGSADAGTPDHDSGETTVDAETALATATQSGAVDEETERDAGDPEPVSEPSSQASTGDAGTAAATAADDAAEEATASRRADDGSADSVEPERAATASTEQAANGASSDTVRDAAPPSEKPMVRSTGSGDGRSPLAQALQEGYRALRSGDLMAARAHYRDAVELAPTNRDARLGAAAVAQRQGNAAAAIEHYRAVLADHPRDPYARSGLASLEGTADPRRIESELKTLLKQDPDAHALRYALWNLYAREQRWAQAQSAYFEAFRAAPGEADYAFNLAVALDQLGKREAAMKYYDEALELAGDG
ncbi:MAG: tetratricopeptide repeat protein, partial [Halofilum sp. (in: g-proteobacteria)]